MNHWGVSLLRNHKIIWLVALVMALLLGIPQPAEAATALTCTWTGATNSDWHTASNWDCAAVPTSNDTVIVPDVANDPVLSANGAALSLTVNTGATVTVNATFVLTLSGALDGDGTISGTLKFAGCGATVNFAGTVEDLIIEIISGFNCGGVLTLAQDLNVTGDLTLQSALVIRDNRILVSGDIVSNDTDGYRNYQEVTTIISLVGSGDQTISGTGALMYVNVNKPSGAVILPSEFPFSGFSSNGGDAELTGTGTISGTLRMTGCAYRSNFAGTVENLKIDITAPGFSCSGLMQFQQNLSVTGDLTLQGTGQMNDNQILVGGDIVSNDADGYRNYQEVTTIISLVGSGDQTISGTGALMYVNVNKPSGAVILPSEFPFSGFSSNGGDAELTGTGTISGTLRMTGCVYRSNFAGTIENLKLDITPPGFSCGGLLSLTQSLTVTGDLTLQNAATIQDNRIFVSGDVVSNDADGYTGSTIVSFNGSSDQNVSGTGRLAHVEFAKAGGEILFDSGFNRTFSSVLVSAGQWDVLGNGVTSSGGFTAQGGKITGAGTLTGTLTVNSGGILGGALTVNGNVTAGSNGTLAAGDSPGQATINGNLALNSGSILAVDINGSTPGTEHDQWLVNGTVAINGAILTGTVGGSLTTPITVIANNATDAIGGSRFVGAATEGGSITIDGVTFLIYYLGDTGNDLVLDEVKLPPTANDDAYVTLKDSVLTIVVGAGVLANDTDLDSTVLTATIGSAPQNGVISLQANGSFVYTPTTGFLGTEVFTYTVSDGVLSDTGLVSIKVVRDSTVALQVSLPITGWNIFGYPLQNTGLVTEVLASIDGKYDRVFGYEPANPGSPWQMYDPTLQAPFDSLLNDLTEMTFGRGYWLHTTEPVTLTLPVDSNARLAANGSTMLALPPTTIYGYLPSQPHAGQPIEAWIGETRCGLGVTQVMADGRTAFAVHVSAADSLTPSCGTVGRAVTLTLAGEAMLTTTWDSSQTSFVDLAPQFTLPIYLPFIGKE